MLAVMVVPRSMMLRHSFRSLLPESLTFDCLKLPVLLPSALAAPVPSLNTSLGILEAMEDLAFAMTTASSLQLYDTVLF